MGNIQSCCVYRSQKNRSNNRLELYQPSEQSEVNLQTSQRNANLLQPHHITTPFITVPQHISEREPEGKHA